jgi:hypothetical protein
LTDPDSGFIKENQKSDMVRSNGVNKAGLLKLFQGDTSANEKLNFLRAKVEEYVCDLNNHLDVARREYLGEVACYFRQDCFTFQTVNACKKEICCFIAHCILSKVCEDKPDDAELIFFGLWQFYFYKDWKEYDLELKENVNKGEFSQANYTQLDANQKTLLKTVFRSERRRAQRRVYSVYESLLDALFEENKTLNDEADIAQLPGP